MTIDTILDAISNWPLSAAIQGSAWAFPIIECTHVLAITLVFGTILIVDLRLLDAASKRCAVTEVTRDTLRLTWGCFGLAAISGSLLFLNNPSGYYHNLPFRLKMVCMLFAAVNMLIFELITFRSVEKWDCDKATPLTARISGGLSILFWVGVIGSARWIGFTIK